MSKLGAFSAVLFDCDGVVVDSEKLGIEIEIAFLNELGLEYGVAEFLTRFGGLADVDFSRLVDGELQQKFGTGMPDGAMARLYERKYECFQRDLLPIEGVREFVRALKGIPVAVASSSTVQMLDFKLKVTDLHDLFSPHIFSTEQARAGKPAPDVFLLAARELGVDSGSCVVIEDSVAGVKAAITAGMTAWGFVGGGHADENLKVRLATAGASIIFESMSEIQQHFA